MGGSEIKVMGQYELEAPERVIRQRELQVFVSVPAGEDEHRLFCFFYDNSDAESSPGVALPYVLSSEGYRLDTQTLTEEPIKIDWNGVLDISEWDDNSGWIRLDMDATEEAANLLETGDCRFVYTAINPDEDRYEGPPLVDRQVLITSKDLTQVTADDLWQWVDLLTVVCLTRDTYNTNQEGQPGLKPVFAAVLKQTQGFEVVFDWLGNEIETSLKRGISNGGLISFMAGLVNMLKGNQLLQQEAGVDFWPDKEAEHRTVSELAPLVLWDLERQVFYALLAPITTQFQWGQPVDGQPFLYVEQKTEVLTELKIQPLVIEVSLKEKQVNMTLRENWQDLLALPGLAVLSPKPNSLPIRGGEEVQPFSHQDVRIHLNQPDSLTDEIIAGILAIRNRFLISPEPGVLTINPLVLAVPWLAVGVMAEWLSKMNEVVNQLTLRQPEKVPTQKQTIIRTTLDYVDFIRRQAQQQALLKSRVVMVPPQVLVQS